MFYFVMLVVLASAAWVYFDATSIGATYRKERPFNYPPVVWAALVFLLWIIALPVYLMNRDDIRRLNQPEERAPGRAPEGEPELAATHAADQQRNGHALIGLSVLLMLYGIFTMFYYSSDEHGFGHIVEGDAYNLGIVATRGVGLLVASLTLAILGVTLLMLEEQRKFKIQLGAQIVLSTQLVLAQLTGTPAATAEERLELDDDDPPSSHPEPSPETAPPPAHPSPPDPPSTA